MIEREIIDNRKVSFRPSRAERLQAIDAEILQEKAEALGRAGLQLEEALDDLGRVRGVVGARNHLDVERCYRISERLR
jgi:hypothetical protein